MTAQLEPAFICTYGPSGGGKSCDALYSFPRGLFVAPPGALKPAETVVGYTPRKTKREAGSVMEITELLPRVSAADFDAVIIDDFSLLVDRTLSILEKRHKNWDLWAAVRDRVIEFRDAARRVRVHVLVNAHEQPPEQKTNGKYVRGGPRLPGQLPNDIPPAVDVCLRAVPYANGTIQSWKFSYRCVPEDPEWSMKDRHGVAPEHGPMNTAELLRCAGYSIRRAPGLEWQEAAVEATSQALLDTGADKNAAASVLQAATDRVRMKYTANEMHIRWVLRDAIDRAAFRRSRRSMLAPFGVV